MSTQRPSSSPWGKLQSCTKLTDGVYFVSTAGHGGIMVHRNVSISGELAGKAIIHQTRSDYWYSFEQDCDVDLVILEFRLDRGIELAPRSTTEDICKRLSRWHPDFLIAKNITPDEEAHKRWQESKIADSRRANKDPQFIVARSYFGASRDKIIVTTADHKEYLVKAKEDKSSELSDYEIIRDLAGLWVNGYRSFLRYFPEGILGDIADLLGISKVTLMTDIKQRAYIIITMNDNFEHELVYYRCNDDGETDEVGGIHLESYPELYQKIRNFAEGR